MPGCNGAARSSHEAIFADDPALLQNDLVGLHDVPVELDALLDTGSVDMAVLFRYRRPAGTDEALLATAETYLVSRPGDSLTRSATLDFARLANLRLVLPRRPAHWRTLLDDAARSKGFQLQAVVEADSLQVQKELAATEHKLYSILGPFSISNELQQHRLQATRLINPELRRYVTLALPKQGQLTAACRVVSRLIRDTVHAWGNQLAGRT